MNILTVWPWKFRSRSRSRKTGLTPFVSEYQAKIFSKVDLENIDQGHDVQHSYRRHSMASISLYKSSTWAFFDSSHRFWDIAYIYIYIYIYIIYIYIYIYILFIYTSRNVVTLKLGQGHDVQHSQCAIQWLLSISIKDVLVHFSLALTVFQILDIIRLKSRTFDLENIGQGHDVQYSQ